MYCVQAALQRRAFFWNQLDAFYRLVEQMSRWNKRCAIMLFSTARWCWQVKPVEMKCLFFSVLDFYAVTQSTSSFVFKATETDGLLARASGSDFYAVSWGRTNLLWVSNQWRWLRIYKEKDFFVCLVCFFFCFVFFRKSWSDLKVAPRLGKPFLLLSCIHVI